jgi:hypothetical protein
MDESGDAGFKFDKGSSRFFVIAAVEFDDTLEVEKTSVVIKELKRKLKFPDDMEFKFNSSSRSTRIHFLKSVSRSKYIVRCLIIDKASITKAELKDQKDSFYSYAVKILLKYSRDSMTDAKIILDGGGDRNFRRNLASNFKKELKSGEKKIIRSIKLMDSRKNMLIQLADMIAGALRKSRESDKDDKDEYIKIFRKHIENQWEIK